jgi:hypothetical protein
MEGRNVRLTQQELDDLAAFQKAFGCKDFDDALTKFFAMVSQINKGKKRGNHLAFVNTKDEIVSKMKL